MASHKEGGKLNPSLREAKRGWSSEAMTG